MLKPSLEEIQKIPKAELHAHLHGCMTRETVKNLYIKKFQEIPQETLQLLDKPKYVIKDCFKFFDVCYQIIQTPEDLEFIMKDVLLDFYNDNVKYLELRSNPRATQTMTKVQYLDTFNLCIDRFLYEHPDMQIKFIYSINRSKPAQDIVDEFSLIEKQYSKYLSGLDFSGNPIANSFASYLDIFQDARSKGYKITVHTAELENQSDTEVILNFKPDRLGHCNFLSTQNLELIQQLQIPIEICPTSNLCALEKENMNEHRFPIFRQYNIPLCICSDDSGMFNTTVSQEIFSIAETFDLNMEQTQELISNSFKYKF